MKIKLRVSLLAFSATAALSVASAADQAQSVPNRVLVKFKNSSALLMQTQSLGALDATRPVGVMNLVQELQENLGVIRYSTGLSPADAARALEEDENIEWAQPDYLLHTMDYQPERKEVDPLSFLTLGLNTLLADPAYIDAPALPSPEQADPMNSQAWGLQAIKAPQAWELQKGSRNIVVADIDTGIDYRHPDLVNNLWVNPDASAEDRHGYDFANKDAYPFDDQGHGTHTAGSIGATGGNGIGISGVAQAVSIMGIKFITKSGYGTTADAISSIDYAIQKGARVMSNSWGGPADGGEENKALVEAVQRAADADILFVAAAGNDGTNNDTRPMYPAAIRLPNVLTVASTTNRDTRSFFSNYGKETVHVGAPGSGVYSTVPGGYQSNSGTSMACPHVAGLAALILAERPDLKAVDVKQIIMETVDAIPALQGKTVTGGRINARAALERARNFGAQ